MISLYDRFWEKVDKNGPVPAHRPELGPCWVWTAGRSHGYGLIYVDRSGKTRAHRVSFFLKHGRWPQPCGLHRCDNRLCVRPSHIFEGTKADNVRDMDAKGRRGTFGLVGERHHVRPLLLFCSKSPAQARDSIHTQSLPDTPSSSPRHMLLQVVDKSCPGSYGHFAFGRPSHRLAWPLRKMLQA